MRAGHQGKPVILAQTTSCSWKQDWPPLGDYYSDIRMQCDVIYIIRPLKQVTNCNRPRKDAYKDRESHPRDVDNT